MWDMTTSLMQKAYFQPIMLTGTEKGNRKPPSGCSNRECCACLRLIVIPTGVPRS